MSLRFLCFNFVVKKFHKILWNCKYPNETRTCGTVEGHYTGNVTKCTVE